LDSRGRIKIESKDEMRKRGLPSPDRGDTLVMTMVDVTAATVDIDAHRSGDSIPAICSAGVVTYLGATFE
jgi:hypothetical protein